MIAVAPVYHDLGIWTNGTFDYVAPAAIRIAAIDNPVLIRGLAHRTGSAAGNVHVPFKTSGRGR